MNDIGSVAEIERWAAIENSEVIHMSLQSQFRCDGSDDYLVWLDDVLEIQKTSEHDFGDMNYDIRILDSPTEVQNLVKERDQAPNHARLLAGYCWSWPEVDRNNVNHHDIKIDDFEMSWNLQAGEPYAVRDTSVDEVGCIYTCQGLEFDYVGVILGEDIRYEQGKIVTDYTKRAGDDYSLKGIAPLYRKNQKEAQRLSDELIKNTYRTLMSRGMKGCYLYCVDAGLRMYLKERVEEIKHGKEDHRTN